MRYLQIRDAPNLRTGFLGDRPLNKVQTNGLQHRLTVAPQSAMYRQSILGQLFSWGQIRAK
jgi:hypothetical protein